MMCLYKVLGEHESNCASSSTFSALPQFSTVSMRFMHRNTEILCSLKIRDKQFAKIDAYSGAGPFRHGKNETRSADTEAQCKGPLALRKLIGSEATDPAHLFYSNRIEACLRCLLCEASQLPFPTGCKRISVGVGDLGKTKPNGNPTSTSLKNWRHSLGPAKQKNISAIQLCTKRRDGGGKPEYRKALW